MEVTQKKYNNPTGVMVLRSFTLLILFLFSTSFLTVAQTDSVSATDSASTAATSDDSGPSIANITKNLNSSAEELERIRHEEIMSYIYMGLGFSVVIGIAWFTTVLARKRKRKEDEVRAIRAANMKHKAHHGHGHHPRR